MSDVRRTLVVLVQANGKSPVKEWLRGIRDKVTRAKIERQINKLARGLGVQKRLQGVSELKIDFGPGYRVYYALLEQGVIVVLIGGGDKSSQNRDIAAAKQLWKDLVGGGHSGAALGTWQENHPEENSPPGGGMN